jgi:aspartate carbamoyltransferase catalytic subunit
MKRDVTSVTDLSNQEIGEIFELADSLAALERNAPETRFCAGKIMATLFYEPSTRTRLSFESAMHRLGGSVISCPDMRASSAAKGESLADTARVVSSYADILVVRHYWDGAVQAMAEFAEVPVINAGDGSHEHPTQTLCDLYTLRKEKGDLKGLTVVICGDLKHGRTIHSLVYALARFGVHVVTLAASGMELPQYVIEKLEAEFRYSLTPIASDELHSVVQETDAVYLMPNQPHQLALFTQVDADVQERLARLAAGVKVDAFYVTRKQKERMADAGGADADDYPRIGEKFLKEKRFKDTVVMHPLPRVDELSREVDKDRRGVYFKQAAYGVPIRMALLKFLFESASRAKPGPLENHARLLYESPKEIGPQCQNPNCVTRMEAASTRPRYEVGIIGPGGGLILSCFYCDHQFKVQYIGHTKSRRYCLYDVSLRDTVRDWVNHGELVIFDSIKQAEELGYEPYKTGPQRNIMDEEEIRQTLQQIAGQILLDIAEPDQLLILGIRTKGVILAQRIAEELEKRRNRKIEVGEIEVYGPGENLRRLFPLESEAEAPPRVKDRAVILVDDVIHTGRTVKSALSIKSGRPQSVRLAVLIDRGHREVPVKPNYVGRHIPSSERERVRVKLREVEQDEKDKVVIYSMITPNEGREPSGRARLWEKWSSTRA